MTMTKPTSEQVTFTAAGSGATLRNLVDKVREVVSVKDFGAVGDGIADDAAAIQAAINTGKAVFLPNGIYKIGAALVLPSGSVVIGESMPNTIVRTTAATNAITIPDTVTVENYNCRIENLLLLGDGVGTIGIQVGSGLNFSARHLITSVSIVGFTSHGIHLNGCSYVTVTECNISSCGGDGIRLNLGLYGGSNTVIGGNMFDNGSYNINLHDKSHYNILSRVHCYYQSGTRIANLRINNSHHTTVDSCTFENLGGTVASHIDVDDTDGATSPNTLANFINGCQLIGLFPYTTNNFRIGISGAVYQTQIDNCTALQASGADVLIGQYGYNTVISRSMRFIGYDAPTTQTDLTVSNTFGNIVTNLPFSAPSGTFTPVLRSTTGTDVSATYTVQQGLYQRLGNRVFFDINIHVNTTSGTPGGSLAITGLPFPLAATVVAGSAAVGTMRTLVTPATYNVDVKARVVSATVQALAQTCILFSYGTSESAIPATQVQAGTIIELTGSYRA